MNKKYSKYIDHKTDYWLGSFRNHADKVNYHGDEFVKLEIQIATILSGFVSFGLFRGDGLSVEVRKLMFFALLSLILSLVFGLFVLHVKQNFWMRGADNLHKVLKVWGKLLKEELTLEDAEKEIAEILPKPKVTSSSISWAIQSLFLLISILLVFLAALLVVSDSFGGSWATLPIVLLLKLIL